MNGEGVALTDRRREVRGRVRPGKASSLLGMVVGVGFVVFGLVAFGGGDRGGFGGMAGPEFGAFGLVWLLGAVGITGFHAYNYFSAEGASTVEWDIDLPPGVEQMTGAIRSGERAPAGGAGDNFDTRLRKLEGLREDGLITEEEYQAKRASILGEKW